MNPFEIEKLVRKRLETMFGTEFRKGKLIIGYTPKGRLQIREFDLISDEKGFIGEIKSGKCSGRNYESALAACIYLSKVNEQISKFKVRRRFMVFTDKGLYKYFRKKSEGLIGKDIDPIFIDL